MPVNFPSTVAYCPVFLVVCSKCTLVTSQERDLMIAPSEPSSGICTSFHGLGYPRSVKETASGASLMLNGNGNGHASFDEEEKPRPHPRGFFADQFEVSTSHS